MAEPPQSKHDRAVAAREAAIDIVRRLTDAGFAAYFAGGCVRDRLMGQEPLDYDVATSAKPAEILELFPRAMAVGESFGVMLIRSRGFNVEIATFRTEGVYSDGRHPDSVAFSDAEHDAQRRDFTINGLFEDPINNEIIDYVGGRTDLDAKVIRAIGDADARLREDRLRMLRAIRFAARFGFAIEAGTADAIRTGADTLQGVSRERIGQEVRRMLTDANRAVAAWEMQYLGLDHIVLRETHSTVAPTRVGRLPDSITYPAALAAWLLDRHEAGHSDFDQLHQFLQRWTEALMLSNAEHAFARDCLEIYTVLRDSWQGIGVAKQKRLAARAEFEQGLALLQATDRPGFIDVKRRVQELAQSDLAPTPLITGNDLIKAGFQPGPGFKDVLDAVYDSQLEGNIADHDEAMNLARTLARDYMQDS